LVSIRLEAGVSNYFPIIRHSRISQGKGEGREGVEAGCIYERTDLEFQTTPDEANRAVERREEAEKF